MAWEEVHQGGEQARGQGRGEGSVTKGRGNLRKGNCERAILEVEVVGEAGGTW